MSFSVAMLKALQAEGLDLAACIRVLSADEPDSAIEKRRAWDRERKREQRLSGGKSGGNPPDPAPNEIDNLTPTRETPKPSGLVAKPKKHRLPANWEPAPFRDGTVAAQTVARWEPGRIERELAKFRDHHTAVGTQWENWQAAWSKWVNGSDQFQRGKNEPSSIGKSQAAWAMLNPGDEPF